MTAPILAAAAILVALVGLIVLDVWRHELRRERARRKAGLADRESSLEG